MSKKEKKILRSFMMITQISITMLVPIFISGWLGTWLNRLFGTQIIFPFMLLLGIGAAFKNVYILTFNIPEAYKNEYYIGVLNCLKETYLYKIWLEKE